MKFRSVIPLMVAGALLPACGGNDGPTAIEIPLARVEITRRCTTVLEGSTCQMEAQGITADDQIVTNAVLRWSSNNSSVAQVNGDGRVLGAGVGLAVITVTAAFGEGEADAEVLVVRCTKVSCD